MVINACNSCLMPKSRFFNQKWKSMHTSNLHAAHMENCNVILIGDSIIANLKKYELWRKFEDLNCVNFGIGGDRVEHVLYRLQNGELSSKSTKVVVPFIGTNNSGDCTPWQIYEGILECINIIQAKLPSVQIILPTLLPRGRIKNNHRSVIKEVNHYILQLQKFEEKRSMYSRNKPIEVVQIHKNIVHNGLISRNIMYDYLHLTNAGYDMCFSLIYDKIQKCLLDISE